MNCFKKRQLRAFSQIRLESQLEAERNIGDMLVIERELELANENMNKDEEIQGLTDEL